MIYTLGNNIVSAFTGGVPVKAVYTYGSLVWQDVPPQVSYYINWTPDISSGTFTLEGVTYNFSDYVSGFSDSSWSGRITAEAFEWNSDIQTIDTNATEVRLNAFSNCHSLTSVNLPECSVVWHYAFAQCDHLQRVNLTNCKSIYSYAFSSNQIMSLSLPNIEYLGTGAFMYCGSMVNLYIGSKCSEIGDRAFQILGTQWPSESTRTVRIDYPWSVPFQGSDIFGYSRASNKRINFVLPVHIVNEYRNWWSSYYSGTATWTSTMFVMGVGVDSGYWSVYSTTNINLTDGRIGSLREVLTNASSITNNISNVWGQLNEITFIYPSVLTAASGALDNYYDTSIYVPSSLISDYETAQYWSVASGHFFPITSLPINN